MRPDRRAACEAQDGSRTSGWRSTRAMLSRPRRPSPGFASRWSALSESEQLLACVRSVERMRARTISSSGLDAAYVGSSEVILVSSSESRSEERESSWSRTCGARRFPRAWCHGRALKAARGKSRLQLSCWAL